MKTVPIIILIWLTESGLAIVSGGLVPLMIKFILRFIVRNTHNSSYFFIIGCVLHWDRAKVRTLIDFLDNAFNHLEKSI